MPETNSAQFPPIQNRPIRKREFIGYAVRTGEKEAFNNWLEQSGGKYLLPEKPILESDLMLAGFAAERWKEADDGDPLKHPWDVAIPFRWR